MRQRGFADAGHILDQEVATCQQASQTKADLIGFAEHDLVDLVEGT
jgi:hypothetical protein